MQYNRHRVACIRLACAVAIVLGVGGVARSSAATSARPGAMASARAKPTAVVRLAQLPLSFEANVGQTDPSVQFLARGSGYILFLTKQGPVLALSNAKPRTRTDLTRFARDPLLGALTPHALPVKVASGRADVVRLSLLGAAPTAHMQGVHELSGRVNYFIGNDPRRWHANVPTYARVRYQGIYPGIDLVYYGNQSQLEYDFVLAPGANPAAIRLAVSGAGAGSQVHASLDARGNLLLRTPGGTVVQQQPVAYQQRGGHRTAVSVRYTLLGAGQVGLQVARYDRGTALVIDPTLMYSTFLGGSGDEVGFGIAVDGSGSAYVTGYTYSADFPTQSSLQPNYGGGGDAFVTKLSPAGTALVYSTYLGGSRNDVGYGIAVDGEGSAYVTGYTWSANFPTQSPFQASLKGVYNAFVTKLSPSGSALVYSTYLGGSSSDEGYGIAVDGEDSAYITGYTFSSDFPTQSAFQPSFVGIVDAFVTKLSPAGSALVYSTYLGGTSYDEGTGIAVDGDGSAYVIGTTRSANFPTQSPFQASLKGDYNAFVTKLSPAGTALVYSTYLGGSSGDQGFSIAVDGQGSAYVTGATYSADFPTQSPFQPSFGAYEDAYVTKLSPAGSALVYSTYLGGSRYDLGYGIAVDGSGSAYVTGTTQSPDFPTQPPAQPTPGGYYDAFVARLSPAGSGLVSSIYLGGYSQDSGQGIAVDGDGSVYVTGYTTSPNFPTQSPVQPNIGGGYDAFVSTLSPVPFAPVITHNPGDQSVSAGGIVTFTAAASGFPRPTVQWQVSTDAGVSFANVSGQTTTTLHIVATIGDNGNRYRAVFTNTLGTVTTSAATLTVTKREQTISFGALAGHSYGDAPFTVSASASSGLPVTFTASGQCTSGGTSGAAITITGAGSCTVTAAQSGNATYNAAPSVPRTFSIAKALTTTSVHSSVSPSAINQAVTFTARVTSTAGIPTGTVRFVDASNANAGLGSGTLVAGVATVTSSTLALGSHTILATFSGDANFAASHGSIVQQVGFCSVSAFMLEGTQGTFNALVAGKPALVNTNLVSFSGQDGSFRLARLAVTACTNPNTGIATATLIGVVNSATGNVYQLGDQITVVIVAHGPSNGPEVSIVDSTHAHTFLLKSVPGGVATIKITVS